MTNVTRMGDFDNDLTDERRKVLCPGCESNYMSEGAELCAKCRGEERGRARSERWLELHEPERARRHLLFRAALDAGYKIPELIRMKTGLPVEGEDYCRIGGGHGA